MNPCQVLFAERSEILGRKLDGLAPALELQFHESDGSVSYRWKADVNEFAMPVKVGRRNAWQIIQPAAEWKTMKWPLKREDFDVATDLYYINVIKR